MPSDQTRALAHFFTPYPLPLPNPCGATFSTFNLASALTTSPATISPATDGTNDMLAGVRLLMTGSSVEYTTFSDTTPRFFSSLRITLHSGHIDVS